MNSLRDVKTFKMVTEKMGNNVDSLDHTAHLNWTITTDKLLRSRFDRLFTGTATKIRQSQERDFKRCNKVSKDRRFDIRDLVYSLRYSEGLNWVKGEIIKVIDPVFV